MLLKSGTPEGLSEGVSDIVGSQNPLHVYQSVRHLMMYESIST